QVAINTFLEGLKKNQDAFQEKVLEKINILVEKSNMQVVEKNIPQDCSGESTTSNIRTPRELSRTLKNLSKQDGYQFIPEERIESVRNSGVREKLNNVLKDKFQDKFTHLEYQVSVTQRYNSERVKFRESQNPDFGDQQKSRRRIRSRQHKLMKRRQLKVLESERPIWKHVKAELMSEEEGEIDGAVLCQKPSWRTDKLNEIINTIDERLKADPKFRVLMNRRKYAQRPCSRPRPTKYFPAELVQPE
ncbi:uncharacterized protein LOC102805615, partial [Saccoglossus kowalevskii]|uniref:Uncharacterized protein C14orf93 homolog n=1 Tax=Saccoglossus kowalevskii TaxID=10224 RepID=A0ABM0MCC4_SACKO